MADDQAPRTLEFIHPDLRHLAVPIELLSEDPENANDHDDASLASIAWSFQKFGQRKPIVVRREGMIAEAGSGTLAALRAAGWTHLACVVCDDDETTAMAYAIADNQSARLSKWNLPQLQVNVDTLLKRDYDLAGLGWSADELADILAGKAGQLDPWPPQELPDGNEPPSPPSASDPEDEPPSPPSQPVTQTGDMWVLGNHRLLCGDSFDADARARLLDGRLADMALMDPPFAIYGSSTGIGADIADDKMIRPFFSELGFIIVGSVAEFAHVYICCDWRSWATIWDGMKGAKLSPKNCLVWDKGGGGLGSMYANGHEFVGFFAKLPPPAAMTSSNKRGQRQVYASNILRFNRPTGENRLHNAAKPVPMMEKLIENSSDQGDMVLDLFNGSGTVIMAGEKAGRHVRAMEMEPGMCDVTVARWERETGRKAERIPAKI